MKTTREDNSDRVEDKLRAEGPAIPEILDELRRGGSGEDQRRHLIRRIEDARRSRLVCYTALAEAPGSEIDLGDVVPLAQVLDEIGQTPRLDLMLHSPGGDANTAEKIIDMFRKHCSQSFAVIVPNMAKSAGTLLTLGADRVTMGYLSELGPIDAQVFMAVAPGGRAEQLSAQSFIDARNELQDNVREAIAKGEPPDAYLQQLALLNPAFVKHCERLMDLARDMAGRWMAGFMLKGDPHAGTKAAETATALSSTSKYFTHGRYISAESLRATPEIHLNIELLDRDDPTWRLIWELYVRSEIYLRFGAPSAKLIETRDSTVRFALPQQ